MPLKAVPWPLDKCDMKHNWVVIEFLITSRPLNTMWIESRLSCEHCSFAPFIPISLFLVAF